MHRTTISLCLALGLVGCGREPSAPAPAAAPAIAPAPAPAPAPAVTEPELIPRELLFGNPERDYVKISPDGKHLSWLAPVDGVLNVWVAPADEPAKARAVTNDRARGIRDYFWTYRPDTLLYLRDDGGDEDFHLYAVDLAGGEGRDLTAFPKTRAKLVGVSHLRPDAVMVGMNDRDGAWHDLYRVDLTTGARTLVARNSDSIADYLVDDEYRLRLATRSRTDGGIDVLQPDGAAWKVFETIPFEDALTTGYEGFTSDGKTVYLQESRGRDTAALVAVDLEKNTRTQVFADPRADVGDVLTDPRTGVVQAVASTYLREAWTAVDPGVAADLQKLAAIGPGEADVMARTLDDRTWIVQYTAAETPPTYYRYDRGAGGALTKLFDSRPGLAGKPLVAMWPREIAARDGLTLVSYLTLPRQTDPDQDGRPDRAGPLVLFVHGGPWWRDHYEHDPTPQWLANRGYAVLQVNYRGSTGFGKQFIRKADREWSGKMHEDLLDAVQWAVKEGVTTADQVAIFGGSYGGYATLVGLTFTPEVFRCGVDVVGPSNLVTLISTFPAYWASNLEKWYRRVGDPRTPEGQQELLARSPITRVDKIQRPLLIGQGANDPRVRQAESDQIVAAMQARKIPVTYVLFPDEGHGFARPENDKAFNAVIEGFLSACLGGRAEPIGDDLAGSSITVPAGADAVAGLAAALEKHTQEVRK